jgi:hypothetical protein
MRHRNCFCTATVRKRYSARWCSCSLQRGDTAIESTAASRASGQKRNQAACSTSSTQRRVAPFALTHQGPGIDDDEPAGGTRRPISKKMRVHPPLEENLDDLDDLIEEAEDETSGIPPVASLPITQHTDTNMVSALAAELSSSVSQWYARRILPVLERNKELELENVDLREKIVHLHQRLNELSQGLGMLLQ